MTGDSASKSVTTRRITKRTLDNLRPGEIAWDADLKGFAVRCQRAAKVYFLKTRVGGRQRWFTIGSHGAPWTPDTARREARRILGENAAGRDPASDRDAARNIPTVAALADRFLAEHVDVKTKPLTADLYRRLIRLSIVPNLGRFKLTDVRRADIAKLHHDLRHTPRKANQVVGVLRRMFGLAEKWGLCPDGSNPCRHIEKYPERKRERFLSEAELARLATCLVEEERTGAEGPYVIAAIRLLIFTGARLAEIRDLEWEWVDMDAATLRLPDSKTGAKVIYLSAPALEVLANLPRVKGNPYVIIGSKAGAHLVNLQKPWRRIRARAELDDLRLHDLRHSFASFGAAGGLSLPMIGKLLGHTQAATTERYAHLAADPIRAANEAIGQRIAAVMRGDKSEATVVEFSQRKGRQ